jgi:hypothetical protein
VWGCGCAGERGVGLRQAVTPGWPEGATVARRQELREASASLLRSPLCAALLPSPAHMRASARMRLLVTLLPLGGQAASGAWRGLWKHQHHHQHQHLHQHPPPPRPPPPQRSQFPMAARLVSLHRRLQLRLSLLAAFRARRSVARTPGLLVLSSVTATMTAAAPMIQCFLRSRSRSCIPWIRGRRGSQSTTLQWSTKG